MLVLVYSILSLELGLVGVEKWHSQERKGASQALLLPSPLICRSLSCSVFPSPLSYPLSRMSVSHQMSKKRKVVAEGVFYAELNEFLKRELAEDGYAGVEVRVTPMRTEIIILATRTQNVLGEKGRRIRELTSLVQKRFNFPEGSVELYAAK
jgi:small subunit ribosomal protein S3e